MRSKTTVAALLTIGFLVGCGAQKESSSSRPASDDAQLVGIGHAMSLPVQALLAAHDLFDALSPMTGEEIARTPEERAKELAARADRKRAGCGKVSVEGDVVIADFSQGCTLASGVHVKGIVRARPLLPKGGSAIGLDLTTERFSVNDAEFVGQVTVSMFGLDGKHFGLSFGLSDEKTFSSATLDLTRDEASKSMAFNAVGSVTLIGYGSVPIVFSLAPGVHVALGACYPDGGAGTVIAGSVGYVFFDAATPTTGIAYGDAAKTKPYRLPAYGACPGPGVVRP